MMMRDLSKLTLSQNQKEIEALRKEQKQIKSSLAKKNSKATHTGGKSKIEAEILDLDKNLYELKRKNNTLEQQKKKNEIKLKEINEKIEDLKKENPVLTKEQNDKEINQFQKSLNQALEKQNEVMNEKKELEVILKKLNKEIKELEISIKKLERCVKARNEDLYHLQQLYNEATRSKDNKKQELNQVYKIKIKMENQRNKLQKNIEEQKMRLKALQDMTRTMKEKKNLKEIERIKDKSYKEIFEWIKSISSVKCINELCDKVKSQLTLMQELKEKEIELKNQNSNLIKEKQAYQEELSNVRKSKNEILKEERDNNENESKEALNRLNERKTELKEIGNKIKELVETLKPISTDIPDIPVNNETLVEVILQSRDKLERALNINVNK